MPNVRFVPSDLSKHPCCPHGPTLLFSRLENGEPRSFFACSACRDRKDCAFFLWQDSLNTFTPKDKKMWKDKTRKLTTSVNNHIVLFKTYNNIKNGSLCERIYCETCESFQPQKYVDKHIEHNLKQEVSDRYLEYPTEFLKPLENSRKEAQYFFSTKTIDCFIEMLKPLEYTKILCIGAPRIHEAIRNKCPEKTSLLLDFDKRFHNFFGPLDFCWYNIFNHHFFKTEAKRIFEDFLASPGKTVIVTDPPFGGRIEPIADTINKINSVFHKKTNNNVKEMDIFLFFPYFMEGQIKNHFPKMEMLDYKVDYDNHALFNGSNAKSKLKFGSPVRIFTNVSLSKIILPEEGYKYCKRCDRYVSIENRHCKLCKACTSKDGRRYKHCAKCQRCVKPAWQHCQKCDRCALKEHVCGEILFMKECFHCNESGHKKQDCPKLLNDDTKITPSKNDRKRKLSDDTKITPKNDKKRKLSDNEKATIQTERNNKIVKKKFKKTK